MRGASLVSQRLEAMAVQPGPCGSKHWLAGAALPQWAALVGTNKRVLASPAAIVKGTPPSARSVRTEGPVLIDVMGAGEVA